MPRLNISPNLFLEVNELNRLVKFLTDDGYKLLIRHLVKSYGIAQDDSNSYFKATTNGNSTITINPGVAFDENLDPIILREEATLTVTRSASKYWVVISRAVTNNEEGTVTVSALGALSGTGTEFTKVLRGQPNYPTKVQLVSNVNTGEYEVVDVTSDTSATLAGSFVAESGVKYQVIGTFTPGFQASEDNRFIYEYDSCALSLVESDTKPEVGDGEYIVASAEYDASGRLTVIDERLPYLFNNENVTSSGDVVSEKNSIAVLRRARLIDGNKLQLFWEFGVMVKRYELVTTSSNNIFNLLQYTSHFFGTDDIPNGVFAGWLLVNRENMKSVVIDNNEGRSLYISKFDSDIIDANSNDFIIVPNYSEIEVEVALSGTAYDELEMPPYYVRFSLQNAQNICVVPLEWGETEVKLRYRMLDNAARTTPFQDFNIAQFINIDGDLETLGASSLTVVAPEPEPEIRNYS